MCSCCAYRLRVHESWLTKLVAIAPNTTTSLPGLASIKALLDFPAQLPTNDGEPLDVAHGARLWICAVRSHGAGVAHFLDIDERHKDARAVSAMMRAHIANANADAHCACTDAMMHMLMKSIVCCTWTHSAPVEAPATCKRRAKCT